MAPTKSELIDSAQKFAQKGQLEKAIREYQQALQLDAGDIQTRLRLGDVFVKKGATREAIEQYVRVADRHATDGFYLKAIAVHKQILKLDPDYIDSSARLADLYHKQGLLSDALAAYQQVAATYDRQGAVREALDTLTKMADLDPQNVAIRVKLGELYLKSSIKESGIEQLLKAAEMLGAAGKAAEQAKLLDKVLAAGPSTTAANRAIVAALLAAGQVEPALKRCQALVAKAPDDPDLRELEAEAWAMAGNAARAAKALEATLAAAPGRVAARRRMIELLVDAGDEAGAAAAADGFGPDGVPANLLDEAAAAGGALAAREPALPPAVQQALQRQLAALHAARGDAAARQAALTAWADAAEAAGDEAAAAEARAALGGPAGRRSPAAAPQSRAAGVPPRPVEAPLADAPAELEIEIDTEIDGAAPEAADGAGADGLELTLDGVPLDTALLDGAAVDAPAGPIALEGGILDLALDAPAPAGDGPEGAPLTVDSGGYLDAAPPDRRVGAPVAPDGGLDLDLTGADEAALALDSAPARSPEQSLMAAGDLELSLDQIPEELEEADFFEQQGLLDAARAIYTRVLAVDPDHPQAVQRLQALGRPRAAGPQGRGSSPAPRPAAASEPPRRGGAATAAAPVDDAGFDLAAALMGGGTPAGLSLLAEAEEQVSFEEVFREFKKGVERQVGDDAETHYNLGIAYKEMGLTEDAIAEFERVLGDPRRAFDAHTMIGLSHLGRGDAESAAAAFRAGLEQPWLTAPQVTALTYEFGLALEAAGRLDEARAAFEAVAGSDPGFREVGARLAALEAAAPGRPRGLSRGQPARAASGRQAEGGGFDPQTLLEDDLPYSAEAESAPAVTDVAPRAAAAPRRPGPAARRDRISFV